MCTLLLFALFGVVQSHAAPPKVVVSILPVHSLVSAVMHGVGVAQLVIQSGQSPHSNLLKPSQARWLEKADLIIWVGAPLERSLKKIVAAQDDAQVVTLLRHDEIMLFSPRQNGGWGEHEKNHETEFLDGRQYDPHIWLSFANAKAIIRIVERELGRLDPLNLDRYAANAQAVLLRMELFQKMSHSQLNAIRGVPYLVFHDAYQYFEAEFDLQPIGAVTVVSHRPAGAKRIRQIKKLIDNHNIRCVFREPQFSPKLVNALIANTDAKNSVLDPIGISLQPGADAWFDLMQDINDSLLACLR